MTGHTSLDLLIGSIKEIPCTEDVVCPLMVQPIIDVCSLSCFQFSGSHLAKVMILPPFSNFMCAFLHCFGIQVGVRIDPKISGYSNVFFRSPSLFP